MKRKRLDRDLWKTMLEKRYTQRIVHTDRFDGIVSLLRIDRVTKPSRWSFPEGRFTVCDRGMLWLEFLPFDGSCLFTAMLTQQKQINVWYIDVADGYGYAPDGVAYYDDLYLDLIVRPGGQIEIDDMDELEAALASGDITDAQFRKAVETKDRLERFVRENLDRLNEFCLELVELMEKQGA